MQLCHEVILKFFLTFGILWRNESHALGPGDVVTEAREGADRENQAGVSRSGYDPTGETRARTSRESPGSARGFASGGGTHAALAGWARLPATGAAPTVLRRLRPGLVSLGGDFAHDRDLFAH
jgi:hypothetical protein